MFRTILLLSVALVLFGGKALSQSITVSVKNTAIEKVFLLIEEQAHVRFFYKQELLKKSSKVTITLKKVSLIQALDACFKGQPFDYEIIGKNIVVKEKSLGGSSLHGKTPDFAPPSYTVAGQILTTSRMPVEGATVKVKGTNKVAICNTQGRFSLLLDKKESILEITSTVTEPKEVTIEKSTELTVFVSEKISELDQVRIIGYGQTTKRLNTGSVTTVRSEEIERQPVNNILAALEGRVPGLIVTQLTGLSGGGFDVMMRGQGTISARSDPLVIVDGVPLPLDLYLTSVSYKFNNYIAKAGGNPLSMLNVADIERVDVLKDADATAIYGSRGGNGVILITTKTAKPEKTTVGLNFYSGIGRLTRLPAMLNLQQYLQMRREAKKNDNAPITANDIDINGMWDSTRSTNWSKELLGGSAKLEDVRLSVAGGIGRMSFLAKSTYHSETTVMPTEGADRNYGLFINASYASKDNKLQTRMTVGYLAKTDDLPPVDFTALLKSYIPNQPPSFLPDGTLNYDRGISNPYKKLKELYKMNARNLLGNVKISYSPVQNLELSASVGYNHQYHHDFYGVPVLAQSPGSKAYAKYTDNRLTTLIVEPQAKYSIAIRGKTRFSALIGSTYQNSTVTYIVNSAFNFENDAFLHLRQYADSLKFEGKSYRNYKYLGSFSRLSFNHRDKYLVNLTGRVDGSSRFGPDKQFRPFGAIGLAWILSQEAFMRRWKWVNLAKLRGSYGIIGNSEIRDYAFSPLYVPYLGPYQGIRGLDLNQPYNSDLGWELKKSLEIAFELQLLNNRLDISISLYRSLNSAQLLYRPLSAVTGFDAVYENSGASVENRGFEMELQYVPYKSTNFSWSLSASAALNKNKLRSFNGMDIQPYNELFAVGKSLTALRLHRIGGVDPVKGTYYFINQDGMPTSTVTSQDRTALVEMSPKSYGSLNSSLQYKSWSFDIHCMLVNRNGRKAFEGYENFPPGLRQNEPKEVLARWQNPGDETRTAKYTQNFQNYLSLKYPLDYDGHYTNASYLRVRNISLSYSFRGLVLKKAHMRNLRVYLQGQNLFTFSPYRNLDPENNSVIPAHNGVPRMPPLRTITAGLQINF